MQSLAPEALIINKIYLLWLLHAFILWFTIWDLNALCLPFLEIPSCSLLFFWAYCAFLDVKPKRREELKKGPESTKVKEKWEEGGPTNTTAFAITPSGTATDFPQNGPLHTVWRRPLWDRETSSIHLLFIESMIELQMNWNKGLKSWGSQVYARVLPVKSYNSFLER